MLPIAKRIRKCLQNKSTIALKKLGSRVACASSPYSRWLNQEIESWTTPQWARRTATNPLQSICWTVLREEYTWAKRGEETGQAASPRGTLQNGISQVYCVYFGHKVPLLDFRGWSFASARSRNIAHHLSVFLKQYYLWFYHPNFHVFIHRP